MQKGLSTDDFARAREFVANADSGDSLLCCREYELHIDPEVTTKTGEPAYYTFPKYPLRSDRHSLVVDEDKSRVYEPLKEDPDLFLRFAQLHKGDRHPAVALGWTHAYAPLNCNLGIYLDRKRYQHMGGWDPREYVEDFFEEVDRAATILSIYEAVLDVDESKVRQLITEAASPFVRKLYMNYWTQYAASEEHNQDMMGFGLFALMAEVSRMVRTYAYQHLHIPEHLLDYTRASRIRPGWGFDNLLGAMYLQMYWLLAAGDKGITRCKYCGELIFLNRRAPDTEGSSKPRKPRHDRQYCDKRCQQRHYYHTTEKFRRQSKRKENQ